MQTAPTSSLNDSLRALRTRRGFTQAELAARSGLSLMSVRSYEAGRRRPTAPALQSIIDAIGLPREEANALMATAGYAIDLYSVFNWGYEPASLADLALEADLLAWPAAVMNQAFDVLHANRHFQAIMEVDLSRDYLEYGSRNMLAHAMEPDFARRAVDWESNIAFMAGQAKADRRWRNQDIDNPSPWLQSVIERLRQGDPELVQRAIAIWNAAPPIPRRMRQRFPIRWLYNGDRPMTFTGVLAMENVVDELTLMEWIPANRDTWAILNEISP
jgi:transcriptional regulator with XRE-family HTH domain